jgi:hypothetical protein
MMRRLKRSFLEYTLVQWLERGRERHQALQSRKAPKLTVFSPKIAKKRTWILPRRSKR